MVSCLVAWGLECRRVKQGVASLFPGRRPTLDCRVLAPIADLENDSQPLHAPSRRRGSYSSGDPYFFAPRGLPGALPAPGIAPGIMPGIAPGMAPGIAPGMPAAGPLARLPAFLSAPAAAKSPPPFFPLAAVLELLGLVLLIFGPLD